MGFASLRMKRLALLIASSLLLATCARTGSFGPEALCLRRDHGPRRLAGRRRGGSLGALGHRIRVLVYLPPGYSTDNSYPTLFLLHGVPGTPDGMFRGCGPPDLPQTT